MSICVIKILENFAERLQECMLYANIKSEQLGEKLGIGGATIRKYCGATSGIRLPNLIKLADYFNCSIDYLLGRTDKQLDFKLHSVMNFSERLRQVLKEKGLSRYSLDRDTKFKDAYFAVWDKGSQLGVVTLVELAEILDCSVDYLVGRDR